MYSVLLCNGFLVLTSIHYTLFVKPNTTLPQGEAISLKKCTVNAIRCGTAQGPNLPSMVLIASVVQVF